MRRYGLHTGIRAAVLLLALQCLEPVSAQEAAEAIQSCLDCHDYGEGAPAHQVLLGSHGIAGDTTDMAGRRGCLDCHGDSEAHVENPRQHAPDLSFGPRWSASGGAQDGPCLDCHLQDSASNWQHSLHMVNSMTCITCHDIHTQQDQVLIASRQNQICTACHKAQKTGIHDLGAKGPENPPCSACHNPHDHEAARPHMASNDSAGCTFCHTAQDMDTLAALNPQAGNYHRAMESSNRGCIDCHQGISHAPRDSAPLLHPAPVRGRQITLFYPGNATRQWLLTRHPGSQPLRQGTACSLCHRGDEAEMGSSLGADLVQPSRELAIAFSQAGEKIFIDLTWPGGIDDEYLALMWGDDRNLEFRRGGCFAACHDDSRGSASRILYHGTGQDETAIMGALASAAQLWRISLESGKLTTAHIGTGISNERSSPTDVTATTEFVAGRWSVRLSINTKAQAGSERFVAGEHYTFGIALHGSDNPGRGHWVSLPMTFSLSGNSTDFVTE